MPALMTATAAVDRVNFDHSWVQIEYIRAVIAKTLAESYYAIGRPFDLTVSFHDVSTQVGRVTRLLAWRLLWVLVDSHWDHRDGNRE